MDNMDSVMYKESMWSDEGTRLTKLGFLVFSVRPLLPGEYKLYSKNEGFRKSVYTGTSVRPR